MTLLITTLAHGQEHIQSFREKGLMSETMACQTKGKNHMHLESIIHQIIQIDSPLSAHWNQ